MKTQSLAAATLLIFSCGIPPELPGDAGELTHVERLSKLGFDTQLATGPTASDGTPLPDGYHPLRKKFSPLDPHAEIYWAGWTHDGHTEGLLDDGFTAMPYASKMAPIDESWTRNAEKAAVAADVDGDGIDEIVAVYYVPANPPALPVSELRVKLVAGKSSGGNLQIVDGSPVTFATDVAATGARPGWFKHSVVAADVDGDGKDEILVAYRNLYVLGDAEHGFKSVRTLEYQSDRMSLAAGDFDAAPGDKTSEFALCFSSGGVAFVDTFDGLELTGHREVLFTLNDTGRTVIKMTEGIMTAGNFDKDNADEVAFYGQEGNNYQVVMMDDANHDYSWFRSFHYYPRGGIDWRTPVNLGLEALDLDGDHIDELFVDMRILKGLQNLPPSSSFDHVDAVSPPKDVTVIDAHFGGYLTIVNPPFEFGYDAHRAWEVTRGNISGIGETAQRAGTEELIAVNPATHVLVMGLIDAQGNFTWQPVPGGGGATDAVTDVLVTANVDRDSAIVRYDGEHQLQFTDPKVLALLSAAPYYDAKSGVEQQTGNSYTAFGTAVNMIDTKERSLGFSVGFSFGYEADFLNVASVKWQVTLEASFDHVATSSRELYQSVTYATGLEDSVVVTSVPYDVYYYTVVSAPEGSQADVGKRMTVGIPRKALTVLTTAKFFDDNNGDAPDVSAMFHHTVGNPKSYPTKADADVACGGVRCFRSELHGVGEGTGFTEALISEGISSSVKYAFDFSQTYEAEVSSGGWTVGASLKLHTGFAIQLTTSKYTLFTGRVGHISGLTPERAYSWGLQAHPAPFGTGGNETLLVDYWVE